MDIFLTCVFFVPWRGCRWIYVTIKFIIIKWITITIELLDAIISKFTKIEYSNHILWRNIYFLYNARLSLYSRPTNCCFRTADSSQTRLQWICSVHSEDGGQPREFLWLSAGAFSYTTHTNVWAEAGSGSITQEIAWRTLTFFFWSVKRLYNHDVQLQFQQCPRMWLSLWFGILFS